MESKNLWYATIVIILGIALVVPVVWYYVISPQDNVWNGMTCEEMFDFAMSPEHQDFTMDQHMEFHKVYDPCIENASK